SALPLGWQKGCRGCALAVAVTPPISPSPVERWRAQAPEAPKGAGRGPPRALPTLGGYKGGLEDRTVGRRWKRFCWVFAVPKSGYNPVGRALEGRFGRWKTGGS